VVLALRCFAISWVSVPHGACVRLGSAHDPPAAEFAAPELPLRLGYAEAVPRHRVHPTRSGHPPPDLARRTGPRAGPSLARAR
jgi:hypothetical protein